jgi:SAM-dependent methyltransferase
LSEFNRLGWAAEGLEPDRAYFERAGKQAAEWRDVVVRRGGFAEIEGGGNFDLVVAMNGPFSYLLTSTEREEGAQRAFGALRHGGLLVLDLANFPWILKNYRAPSPERRTVEGITVTRVPLHSLDFHDCIWTHTDLFVTQGGGVVEKVHRMSMVGYPEVARVLRLSGFDEITTYNGYESRQSEELNGSRMLVTARKPEQ